MNIKKTGGRANIAADAEKEGLRWLGFAICIFALSGFFLLIVHNVGTKITKEDSIALNKMVIQSGHTGILAKKAQAYNDQIIQIRQIQDAVLNTSPTLKKIPLGQSREPEALLQNTHGQCSDRARSIQKALIMAGYQTRFAALFSRDKTYTPPETMAIDTGRDLRSHAVIEVKTNKGWLVVDTNSRWLSLDGQGNPVSLSSWNIYLKDENFKWSKDNKGEIYWLMKRPFTTIYGLYSRHGKFYAPYTPLIPDVNIKEFLLDNAKTVF